MDLVTPLEVACVAWHGEVVEKMISASDVDANLPDKNGQTPMHVAAMNGTVDILDKLLKCKDIDINRYACGLSSNIDCRFGSVILSQNVI